eukprot:gnl/MRDRNA2_/MRDRNA2_85856_c0_seq1.p1 gnl/MRDRNA2_/MRDRNA2_85856_c0~~gnl/MRDRNA2_/MRDRNA2_85856_c0_seq1.p1  ORF type:complete len:184 (+),score=32.39 gnl/MRDRNA2_/MRDRNA2_85856_c0_seq1:123-674(+)
MTSVEETLPEDKEKEPVNDDVGTNEEIQIENNEKEQEKEEEPIEQTPTEFCEEAKETTRVQKLFECPKCKKMLTKKTLNYYHECTKNDAPKAKRRPKKIVVKDIVEEEEGFPNENTPPPQKVKLTRQTNQIVEQGEKFLTSIEDIEDIKPPVQKSYEELRKERLQQRIQQRTVKIQQLFQSAI